ncbi:aldo/keto reductase [Rarobacter incanus]|uniref:Aryl-alcohol dehydrogenase-like predicted oxidoreductase n=1 Tax=Rarobacter incanus TaxID=153494 RepID=A0A542SRM3_9MICO|nr:aldo/keto reductase [Rarobacter incanus]TQK77271.1 aryl-alcohol dehydrogenase-like predicted oxidoreductase [Rarobacter incanus]
MTSSTPTTRQLGRSGLTVSVVGLGCNNFGSAGTATADQAGTDAVVHAAIDAGITLFDTADIYGTRNGESERLLGRALRGRRGHIVLATKFGMDMEAEAAVPGARGSRRYITAALDASLKRLQTDYIDLYQFHTPDPLTPIDETLSALDDAVRAGKVRYIGHSNRAGWQISQAHYVARELGVTRFVSSQNHFNLLDRRAELEVLPAAVDLGLGVLPYFPLANGLLTGKYRRDAAAPAGTRLAGRKSSLMTSAPWDQLEQFFGLADGAGLSPLELAISWLAAQRPVTSVIAGATRPDQVRQNALAVHPLSSDVLAAIDGIFPAPAPIALF